MSNGEVVQFIDVNSPTPFADTISIKRPVCVTCINYNPGIPKGFCVDCLGNHIFSNDYYKAKTMD